MNDFNSLFDNWAPNYDDTVYSNDNEYAEVFEGYEEILDAICEKLSRKSDSVVLEIGVGTGNLSQALSGKGYEIIGIEPSTEMRKIAKQKLPHISILDGNFLSIPIEVKVDAMVTSYALHHLTLEEKREALSYIDTMLNEDGMMVIADTMFESKEYKLNLYKYVENSGALNLLHDLNTEFYEELNDICNILTELNYTVEAEKMNKYVWIVTAKKRGNM